MKDAFRTHKSAAARVADMGPRDLRNPSHRTVECPACGQGSTWYPRPDPCGYGATIEACDRCDYRAVITGRRVPWEAPSRNGASEPARLKSGKLRGYQWQNPQPDGSPPVCGCGCGEPAPLQAGRNDRYRLYAEGHRERTLSTKPKDVRRREHERAKRGQAA